MKIDEILAENIGRTIATRRDSARAIDPRTTTWTDRDVARRMTQAGYPMQHPAVIRARTGKRTLSTEEWLAFALVLSTAPLSLFAPPDDASIVIGNKDYSADDIAAWVNGSRPLAAVSEPGQFYHSAGMRTSQTDFFAGVLRGYADHLETTTDEVERLKLLGAIAIAALGQQQADERIKQLKEVRKGRTRRTGGKA